MEENQQEPQVINIGSIDLHLAPNGKDAIATFGLLGALQISVTIPEGVITQFDQERLEVKKSSLILLPKKGLHA